MLKRERDAYNMVADLARASQDPMNAAKNISKISRLLDALQPSVNRTSDVAQRVITVDFSQQVVVGAGPTITPSNLQPVQFPAPGRVVGVKGCVVEGDSTAGLFLNFIGVSVAINGDRYLITNGQTQTFVALSALKGQPTSGDPSHEWFPLDNAVTPADKWFVQATALSTTVPQATYTPKLYFLFEADDMGGPAGR